mgnify:CR=1 FL=1
MWFKNESGIVVSLPGVPYEMKALFTEQVLQIIQNSFNTPYIKHKTVVTEGLGESVIANRTIDFENSLPAHIKLAYLPKLNMVRLRLSGKGNNEDLLNKEIEDLTVQLVSQLKDVVVGYDDDTPEQSVIKLLQENKDLELQNIKLLNSISSLKSTLSFQLGNYLVTTPKTPLGLIKIPLNVFRIYRDFNSIDRTVLSISTW